ncbi:MAG: response regulator transcription factor [Okeania sp. SIO2D1]|nr:response regulator transcription factor [Okeania sp. SIO2D1]
MMMSSFQRQILRVLVVDDHELTRFTLKIALSEQENFNLVGIASNGQEAMTMFKKYLPEVVILDLQMPIMDGFTASEEMKRFAPSTQIIAYSSLESQQLDKNTSCIDAFCQKEANTEVLIELVNRLGQRAINHKSA